MRPVTPFKYGTCQVCGKVCCLQTQSGKLRAHGYALKGRSHLNACPGTGQLPVQVETLFGEASRNFLAAQLAKLRVERVNVLNGTQAAALTGAEALAARYGDAPPAGPPTENSPEVRTLDAQIKDLESRLGDIDRAARQVDQVVSPRCKTRAVPYPTGTIFRDRRFRDWIVMALLPPYISSTARTLRAPTYLCRLGTDGSGREKRFTQSAVSRGVPRHKTTLIDRSDR